MSQFKKKSQTTQEIPTSALPDIIFILLFFFMVTTKMKKSDVMVFNRLPKATQLEELANKNVVSYIYIGEPRKSGVFGTAPKIQVNDSFIDSKLIPKFIEEEKTRLGEKKALLEVSLKVDSETKMGIVTDVKQELRKMDARSINYTASKKMERR